MSDEEATPCPRTPCPPWVSFWCQQAGVVVGGVARQWSQPLMRPSGAFKGGSSSDRLDAVLLQQRGRRLYASGKEDHRGEQTDSWLVTTGKDRRRAVSQTLEPRTRRPEGTLRSHSPSKSCEQSHVRAESWACSERRISLMRKSIRRVVRGKGTSRRPEMAKCLVS